MKSQLTPLSQQISLRIRSCLCILGVFALIVACGTVKPTLTEDPVLTVGPVHVAMSGGGWRAHSAHAGWTMALLGAGQRNLSSAFQNVETISSNSGGSWFSTMLMFSKDFVKDIEAPSAYSTWSTTGWLGKQKNLFDAASCHSLSGEEFTLCVFENYATASDWNSVVEKLVFKDYSLGSTLMNGMRQPWATNKNLLLASSLLTTEVVLTGSALGDKQYYQGCISPSQPSPISNTGMTCSNGSVPDVTPATFSSIPRGTSYSAPPFLPELGVGSGSLQLNLGYTETVWRGTPTLITNSIRNPISNDGVPVMKAAAASSAAGGFAASHHVTQSWPESYEGENEAPSFKLTRNNVIPVDATNLSLQQLGEQQVVRIADGGPVDNSGVAQLVQFLQQSGQGNGFNIVAFDNVQEIYPTSGPAMAGIDIANLFGENICPNNQFCSGDNCDGTCVTTPPLQIFVKSTFLGTPITWIASTSSTKYAQKLIYTKYTVTTIDNPTYGISGNRTGTLHAFTCVWENADTAPENHTLDGDFTAYSDMLKFIHAALRQDGAKGLKYLNAAMGLSSN